MDPSPSPDPFPMAPSHPRVESWTALWFANRIEKSSGVHFIEMTEWGAKDADIDVTG
jgi:hypothetical protein